MLYLSRFIPIYNQLITTLTMQSTSFTLHPVSLHGPAATRGMSKSPGISNCTIVLPSPSSSSLSDLSSSHRDPYGIRVIAIIGIFVGILITLVSLSRIALHVYQRNRNRNRNRNRQMEQSLNLGLPSQSAGSSIGVSNQASDVEHGRVNTRRTTGPVPFFNGYTTTENPVCSAELYADQACAELDSPTQNRSTVKPSFSSRIPFLDNNVLKADGGEYHTGLSGSTMVVPNATHQARPASSHRSLTFPSFMLQETETQSPWMQGYSAVYSSQPMSPGVPASQQHCFNAIVPASMTDDLSCPDSSWGLLSDLDSAASASSPMTPWSQIWNYSPDRLGSGEIRRKGDYASHQVYAAECEPPSLDTSHRSNRLQGSSPAATTSSTHETLPEYSSLHGASAVKVSSAFRTCSVCKRSFHGKSASSNLMRHKTEQHPDRGTKPRYPCPDCGKDYSRPDYLSSHKCKAVVMNNMSSDNHSLLGIVVDVTDRDRHSSTSKGGKRKRSEGAN